MTGDAIENMSAQGEAIASGSPFPAMPSRRIILFDDRFFEVYGAQENLLILARHGCDLGTDIQLWTTFEGRLADAARERGVPVRIVEAPPALRIYGKRLVSGGPIASLTTAIRVLRYSFTLHAAMVESRPDVVVAGAVRASLLMTVTRLSGRIATILFAQNSTPFGILAAASLVGLDRVALISKGSITTFPHWTHRWIRRRLASLPSGRALQRYAPTRSARGVEKRSPEEATLHIVSICGISERKGLHVLIEAVARASVAGVTATLAVVGAPSDDDAGAAYADSLVELAGRVGVTVDWCGWQDDVRPYLAASNVFALASSHEGLPGVIIEAMAAGLPVVSTDAGGCAEIVVDGVTGFVVPVGDVEAFTRALVALAAPARRCSMGAGGRERAVEEFTASAFWKRFDALVSSTLGTRATAIGRLGNRKS